MKIRLRIYLIFLSIFLCSKICTANLIVNGGFEEDTAFSNSIPNGYGYWGYDKTEIVSASNGITPFEGSRMLHFICSSPSSPGSGDQCNVYQLIDISSFLNRISTGNAIAQISARYNRVAGDNQTDSLFTLSLYAMQGQPSSFSPYNSLLWGRPGTDAILYSDGNINTWELLGLNVALPTGTQYLGIQIRAQENVFNDTSGIEFDGHYVDAVSVEIIPEPCSLVLLCIGGLLLRRRKK